MPNQYDKTIAKRIRHLPPRQVESLMGILSGLGGADPRTVERIAHELVEFKSSTYLDPAIGRQFSNGLPWRLPAPDRSLAQWWFTVDTIDDLIQEMLEDVEPEDHIVCIGAPTVGARLLREKAQVTVLDVDEDVVRAVKEAIGPADDDCACVYDAANPLAESMRGSAKVAIIDPPWYLADQKNFLLRAAEALVDGGLLFSTIPSDLTRPDVEQERAELLTYMASLGLSILGLDRRRVRYVVPKFEERAFHDVEGFFARPWRTGDMIRARKTGEVPELPAEASGRLQARTFARDPAEFRVFLGSTTRSNEFPISEEHAYERSVSRAAMGDVDIWTSDNAGATLRDTSQAELILRWWTDGETLEDTIEKLSTHMRTTTHTGRTPRETEADARKTIDEYNKILGLWSRWGNEAVRRTSSEIATRRANDHGPWASAPSEREHTQSNDGFRPEFQRDRDRILWCPSFRRLKNKTQLFPFEHDDKLRDRLSHSIEVMQLANTISESFGLDEELTEAGALAHDIGHTPFGHAGEVALDKMMKAIGYKPGFNHYEHGVDVVRYLEGAYHAGKRLNEGLNLTPEVAECIFKHTYCQQGPGVSHDEIRKYSKHAEFLADGYCHVEGQAVRYADKLSYLISDLEDGVALGAIDEDALRSSRLFNRPGIDLPPEGKLEQRLVSQRSNIIRLLMEDAITETSRRLGRIPLGSDVRGLDHYVVGNSSDLQADVDEVWTRVQAHRLHNDARVLRANAMSARIVSDLFVVLAIWPQFVDDGFRAAHQRLHTSAYMRHYRSSLQDQVEVPDKFLTFLPLDRIIGQTGNPGTVRLEDIVLAKDFIASMSDVTARRIHRTLIGGSSTLATD